MVNKHRMQVFAGEVVEEGPALSLAEICSACGIHAERIIEFVELGIVEPENRNQARWRFSSTSMLRINKARRLQRDLGVDPAGLALVLDLLDEIDALHARIRLLEPQSPD